MGAICKVSQRCPSFLTKYIDFLYNSTIFCREIINKEDISSFWEVLVNICKAIFPFNQQEILIVIVSSFKKN